MFLGFSVAASVFFLIFVLGNVLLKDYFINSDFIYNAENAYIEELRSYVEKEKIAATDTSSLGDWAHKKGVTHFTISRNRVLIYDSSYSDTVLLGRAETESLHNNWQYFHSIRFADGDADVYIYANFEMKYYMFFYLLDITLSVSIWLLIFVLGLKKKVQYIQQLSHSVSKIELGALDYAIPITGTDELSILARGLDNMRLALIEKKENEKELKSAQDKLVLGMAHDLRTPLTGLMSFLEIAKKQKGLNDCVNYVEKSYTKAIQIRNLSNQLFEFFLINSKQSMKMEAAEPVEYALGEYLSELCVLLEMGGFSVNIDQLFWKPVKIHICTDYAGRIVDNLVSNIIKYALPEVPVKFATKYESSYVSICIKNRIATPNQFVQGTGIGVKNIQTMMAQMGGKCSVNLEQNYYSILLSFPIVHSVSIITTKICPPSVMNIPLRGNRNSGTSETTSPGLRNPDSGITENTR